MATSNAPYVENDTNSAMKAGNGSMVAFSEAKGKRRVKENELFEEETFEQG